MTNQFSVRVPVRVNRASVAEEFGAGGTAESGALYQEFVGSTTGSCRARGVHPERQHLWVFYFLRFSTCVSFLWVFYHTTSPAALELLII